MKQSLIRWGTAGLIALAAAGCGGGGGGGGQPAPSAAVLGAIASASLVAANDTAINSSAPFTVVQAAGIAAVTINSPPKVNFAVFSDGAVKTDLKITNVSFAIAKLVPGTNSNPDEWRNYIYRTESTATAPNNVGSGTGGTPALASAKQATTDGKMSDAELLAAQLSAQLIYNAGGYYTYTFKTDIKDTTKTNGVVFEPGLTHRVAIQLSYKNAAGEDVKVNPYFDFTIDASGKSVPVTDPTKTRKMTDVSSCNGCHEKLALHGGGRVDTQYCVMCHNPGTFDANSGNNLNLSTMVHKIHAGKLLKSKLAAGGEDYTIWGYGSSKHNYAEVGFPQDLRNCAVCHSGANPKTPQGDNWKSKPSKEACLTCHANNAGSDWDTTHKVFASEAAAAGFITDGTLAKNLTNNLCAGCHSVDSAVASERVHWNQNEENAAKYKMNIESATYDATSRKVTVKYFLSDPTNNSAAYNLVTSDCASTTVPTCGSATKFGNLRFYLAYQNMIGQTTAVTEFSAGSGVRADAYKGSNDGNNHYTVELALPADSATAVAAGTARVVSIGQVKEAKLEVKSTSDPRPEVSPKVLINTLVQHTYKELALTGTLNPRRAIVSNEKCNVCHGALGATSGSNTLAEAFHGGARNTVEACVVCHDANRASSTVMTNGLVLNESYQFKRMIHGIHGNSKRTYPFTHGNKVVDAFNKDGSSSTGGAPLASDVENYAAEVAWPGVGINCNACHINNSYKSDQGPLGSVVLKGPVTLVGSGFTVAADANPNNWFVISPKAASCTACHDSSKAMGHVTSFGGATFGDKTQGEIASLPRETCDDCHASGFFKGVDIVHGQK
jgi:OmcA/MtrC family decaheme c-type cytochrome